MRSLLTFIVGGKRTKLSVETGEYDYSTSGISTVLDAPMIKTVEAEIQAKYPGTTVEFVGPGVDVYEYDPSGEFREGGKYW